FQPATNPDKLSERGKPSALHPLPSCMSDKFSLSRLDTILGGPRAWAASENAEGQVTALSSVPYSPGRRCPHVRTQYQSASPLHRGRTVTRRLLPCSCVDPLPCPRSLGRASAQLPPTEVAWS